MTKTTKGSPTLNILLTGSTSQQCNSATHRNAANYPGLLRTAFHLTGHEVYWQAPSVSWTGRELLNRYDHVVVGLAPVTSLSANRVYGALSMLGELMDVNPNKVSVLLDVPEPDRIAAGFRAILAHPENLAKSFYSYRKEYELAVRAQDRLLGIVERLHSRPWPTVIMPSLPWDEPSRAAHRFPYPVQRVLPFNLETVLYRQLPSVETRPRREIWAAEGRALQATIFPHAPISRKGHSATDTAILQQMASSLGTIIELTRGGIWWNTRYAQSLRTGTPVVSDWRETSVLGRAWGMLPMTLETMNQRERDEVAHDQRAQYLAQCPSEDEIVDQMTRLLRTRAKTSVLA